MSVASPVLAKAGAGLATWIVNSLGMLAGRLDWVRQDRSEEKIFDPLFEFTTSY
jgi:hypothetical protein